MPDGYTTLHITHYTAQAGQHVQVRCCDVHTGTGGTAMNGHLNTGGGVPVSTAVFRVYGICRMKWDEIKM